MLKVLCGSSGCPPPAPQPPQDEDHGVAACPTPTAAMGLAVRSPCRGAGRCSFFPVPSRAAHGLPFSVAEAVHVGKAGPGIKNKNTPGEGCVGRVCNQGWPGCGGSVPRAASARRGEAIWAFAAMGRGLLNKELIFFFLFLTRARAVQQPARSRSVLVPVPSACCRAGAPPPPGPPGGVGPGAGGLGSGCRPLVTRKRGPHSVPCPAAWAAPGPHFPAWGVISPAAVGTI